MSELAFSVTVADCVAFADYHLAYSAAGKRARRTILLVFGLLSLAMAVFAWVGSGRWLGAVPYLVIGGICVAIVPRIMRWAQRRQTLKVYGDGTHRTLIGEHRVRLDVAGVTWRSPHHESRYEWPAFEGIASTADHTFVYLGSHQGLVIPRQGVREGEYGAFVSALAGRVKAAT